jgi:hypothetical protein
VQGEHAISKAALKADLIEIIRTTRPMRRLKPDPVPNELIPQDRWSRTSAPERLNMQRLRCLTINLNDEDHQLGYIEVTTNLSNIQSFSAAHYSDGHDKSAGEAHPNCGG